MSDVKLTSQLTSQFKVQEDVIMLRIENEELKRALDEQTEELTTLQEQYQILNEQYQILNEQCKQMRCCENCGHYNFYNDDCECPNQCISLDQWMC